MQAAVTGGLFKMNRKFTIYRRVAGSQVMIDYEMVCFYVALTVYPGILLQRISRCSCSEQMGRRQRNKAKKVSPLGMRYGWRMIELKLHILLTVNR